MATVHWLAAGRLAVGSWQKVRMRNVAEITPSVQNRPKYLSDSAESDEKESGTEFWRARLGATDELVAP